MPYVIPWQMDLECLGRLRVGRKSDINDVLEERLLVHVCPICVPGEAGR